MMRSREWQTGPSLRPIWAVGAQFSWMRQLEADWLLPIFQKIRKQFGGSSANDGICSADTSNSADSTDRQLISSLAAEGLLECNTPALKSRKMNSKNIRILWQSPTGHTKYGNNWPPNFLFYSIQRPPHSLGHSFACRHQHFFRRFPVKKKKQEEFHEFLSHYSHKIFKWVATAH